MHYSVNITAVATIGKISSLEPHLHVYISGTDLNKIASLIGLKRFFKKAFFKDNKVNNCIHLIPKGVYDRINKHNAIDDLCTEDGDPIYNLRRRYYKSVLFNLRQALVISDLYMEVVDEPD